MFARPTARPGTTIPITAVCVVALFAFTALAVDLGMLMVSRTECQNAADAAALAGARQLNTVDLTTNNQPAALVAADETAATNPIHAGQFQKSTGTIDAATAWGATAGRSLASGQGSGSVPKSINLGGKVAAMKVGLYAYNTTTQRFSPDFVTATRATNQAWTAVQVDTTSVQPAFFSRIFGMAGLQTQARAVAIHRPRDIALVLDMSNSMRFGSTWNWNRIVGTAGNGSDGGGTMSPDPLYPQFGHYARYDAYNNGSSGTTAVTPTSNWAAVAVANRPNPFYQLSTVPISASSSEVLAPHNYSVQTGGGPPAVKDFLTGTPIAGATPTANMTRAFHHWDPPGFNPVFGGPTSPVAPTGDFTGWSVSAPMPAPPGFGKQDEAGSRMGDRWPRKWGSNSYTSSWAVDDPNGAAVTLAEFLGWNKARFSSANSSWPVNDGSDGVNGYARNAIAGTNSATASTSLPDQFTGAASATFNVGPSRGVSSAVALAYNNGGQMPPYTNWNGTLPAATSRQGVLAATAGTDTVNGYNQPLVPRNWDYFRDATWERNGYDLDTVDYVTNRPADWDPRWEWNLGADRTRPVAGGKVAWWGTFNDFPRPGRLDSFDPRDNLNNQAYNQGASTDPNYRVKDFTATNLSPLTTAPSGGTVPDLMNPYGSTEASPNGTNGWRPKLKPAAERFKGYTLSPGYYGKTFYIWPPDPRTPMGEPGDANYQPGDWRLRYFLWTPPIRPTYAASPPTSAPPGQPTGGTWTTSASWTQIPGTAYDQYREGTWTYTYTYTPPSTTTTTTSSSGSTSGTSGTSSSGSTSTSSSSSSSGTGPPPPPPPPVRHDRNLKPRTAAEVVRLRNRLNGEEFTAAVLQTPPGQTPLPGEYPTPTRFGNINRTLFGDGRDSSWNSKPSPITNEQTNDDSRWSFSINYPAILRWIKAPPQTLPSSLRGGRLVYYKTIPNDVDYSTGTADDIADKYFWREYIEFVMCQWDYRNRDNRHLAGLEFVGWPELGSVRVSPRVNMSWLSLGDWVPNGFGTNWNPVDGVNGGYDPNPIYGRDRLYARNTTSPFGYNWNLPLNNPTANPYFAGQQTQLPRDLRPYMGYMDNPARPRQHFWFGPLSMMAFLANLHDGTNMWPGTVSEAQSWQLKAAVDSALDDVQKNHPNDAVGLAYFSSKLNGGTGSTAWNVQSGYKTIAAPLGQDFTRIKNSLYYPLQMVQNGDINDPTKEYRPYNNGGTLSYQGIARVPNAQSGTDPNTGLALAYNILSPSSASALNRTVTQRGRKGAAKIVIFETDGAPSTALNLTMNQNGPDSYYTVGNAGVATSTYFQTARDEAIKVVQQIVKPVNDSAGTDYGFSTPNTPARVYSIGFGDLFQYTGTPTATQQQAMDFLRDVMIAGNTLPASAAGTPGYLALPADNVVGDPNYSDRMAKIGRAFERILQSGVQVTLIE